MLPVNYCSGFTSLKLYDHVKFSISIMHRPTLFSNLIPYFLNNYDFNFNDTTILSPFPIIIFHFVN